MIENKKQSVKNLIEKFENMNKKDDNTEKRISENPKNNFLNLKSNFEGKDNKKDQSKKSLNMVGITFNNENSLKPRSITTSTRKKNLSQIDFQNYDNKNLNPVLLKAPGLFLFLLYFSLKKYFRRKKGKKIIH